MSATAATLPAPPSGLTLGGRGARLVAAALVAVLTPLAAWWTPLRAADPLLTARAAETTALAPGAEASLLLAGALEESLALSPVLALSAASWAGLPVLLIAVLALGRRRPVRAAIIAASVAFNPLTLWACAAGYGLAASGFLLMWSQILALPDRPSHLGMPRAGLGIASAAALAPGFSGFALPIFSILFLAAPPSLAKRNMLAVYLIAFLPVCAWAAMLAYAAWLSGAAGPGALPGTGLAGEPVAAAVTIALALGTLCAPSLVSGRRTRPLGLASILACALAACDPQVPLALALLCATMAGGAKAVSAEGAPFGLSLAAGGALCAVWLVLS